MTVTHTGEVSRIDVRVNPGNGDFAMDDPEYVQGQIEKQDSLKQILVERMREGIEDGTFSPSQSGEAIEEADILFMAQRMAQRTMTIQAALGGYGLVGKVEGLGFHGVDVNWIPDETVAKGAFEFEGVEDPKATMEYLHTIMP